MGEESTSSSAIWAVAMIIIVALIVGGIFYMVRMGGPATPKKVDVDVTVPSR
jgi:flagellar biogenesis protein FliO